MPTTRASSSSPSDPSCSGPSPAVRRASVPAWRGGSTTPPTSRATRTETCQACSGSVPIGMCGPCHSSGPTGTKIAGTLCRASTISPGRISSYSTLRIRERLMASGGKEHLRQDLDVESRLLRRRPAGLALGHAAVEVAELAREALSVGPGDARVVRLAVAFAAPVGRRVLLEPGGGKTSVRTESAKKSETDSRYSCV